MADDRWERLAEVFHSAIACPPEDRARLIETECAGDPALRSEVERLVAAHGRAGGFIETPAISLPALWPAVASDAMIAGQRFGHYRIVREIGHGGMGAVYLAERADGEYQSRVAIKLIKRGMDSDLVLRRFRAERQILASLEHPNIARLLDGGTTDGGQPYFVMEYIDGPPIDEYADTHRLSVADRLRLFLQVCSAVERAHRSNVVHRDIKPVNILVASDGVPKLLDFGIARVLDPDAEPTSSMTTVRMLTPEYASPEQVEGRHATVASDIYSLGVVLYELLTGRSPYRLRSRDPREVSDAVRTTEPEAPSTAVSRGRESSAQSPRRPGLAEDRAAATRTENMDRLRRRLRGDLDTIVLKALRKEPHRRYESVEAFASDIRRHLDGHPIRARPDSATYRVSKFVRRRGTGVATAALAAAAVLVLSVALLRTADRRASLIGAGALRPRDRILVADLTNHADDPSLVAALSDALRVGLSESPLVQVLSERQVRSALQRMERSPEQPLDDATARELAVREGVKVVVTGAVSKAAGQFTISSQLMNAQTGDLLAAVLETARDSSDVIGATDRLADRIRRRVGESLQGVRATASLEQVTTASLAALRAYSEGVRAIGRGDRTRGITLLESAVARDTGFASAYRVLGITYGDLVESGQASAALDHAIANQARLPFYERYHTIASHAYNVLGDFDAAIAAYQHILERYPDDVRALNNLAYVHGLRRRYAAQETLLVRATAIDSTIPIVLGQLAVAQMNRGDFAAARATLVALKATFPNFFNERLGEIYLAAAQQDWDTAERRARARLDVDPGDSLDRLDGLETLAGILMTEGRLDEAAQASRAVLAIAARVQSATRYLSSALRLADIELAYRGDTTKACALVDEATARFPLDSIAEGGRPYDEIARFFAAAHRPARARALIARAERTRFDRLRKARSNRRWTNGVLASAEGRVQDAEPLLRQAADSLECPICVLPDLAHLYDTNGRAAAAIATYEQYLATPWEWRFETDGLALGRSMIRLAELYAQRGDTSRAVATYTRVLSLWRRADRELQPTLTDVRRRLTRLTGGAALKP